jgi:hypothetical protein
MRVGSALLLVLLGAGSTVGFLWLREDRAQARRVRELEAQVRDLGTRLERRRAETYVANARVLGIREDPATGEPIWKLEFSEVDERGVPLHEAQVFEVRGREIYFDALVVEFEDEFVEVGDGLRGKSLHLFRRAFGDRDRPAEGVPLWNASGDEIPAIYEPRTLEASAEALEFERRIWREFWALAEDPVAARARGVRLAYGDAKYQRLSVGRVFRLTLRHSGGLSIE